MPQNQAPAASSSEANLAFLVSFLTFHLPVPSKDEERHVDQHDDDVPPFPSFCNISLVDAGWVYQVLVEQDESHTHRCQDSVADCEAPVAGDEQNESQCRLDTGLGNLKQHEGGRCVCWVQRSNDDC